MCGRAAAGGALAPRNTARRRRFTIVLCGGRGAAYGRTCSALADRGRSSDTQMIDSTHIKAHRSASGGKGGSKNKRLDVRAAGAIRRSTQSQMLKAVFFPSF